MWLKLNNDVWVNKWINFGMHRFIPSTLSIFGLLIKIFRGLWVFWGKIKQILFKYKHCFCPLPLVISPSQMNAQAGPQIALFCSTCFVIMLMRGKINCQPESLCVCGVSTFSPCLVGFLQMFQFSLTSQRCAWEMNWCIPTWVGMCPMMEGRPVQGVSHLMPWATKRGSGQPQPWTGINEVGK